MADVQLEEEVLPVQVEEPEEELEELFLEEAGVTLEEFREAAEIFLEEDNA